MFVVIYLFLIFIYLYHILNTVFLFGILGWLNNILVSSIKDILWIGIFLVIAWLNLSFIKSFIIKYKKSVISFFILLARSLLISVLNHKNVVDIVVWIKYDLYFLFVFLSAIFTWYVYSKDKIWFQKYFNIFMWSSVFIILFWFLRQGLKYFFPDIFYKIWYWPVGDYVHWTNPPIYYRTGRGGMERLSWIFSGPNNYGYFLVLFFSLYFTYFYNKFKNKIYSWFAIIPYLVATVWTLSRWAIIWVWVQLYLLISNMIKNKKYLYLWTFFAVIIWIVLILFTKHSSSIEHILKTNDSLKYVISNIWWYWLGTSWPSVHYNWYLLPENTYLQILIDLWVIGMICWIMFFYYILKPHFVSKKFDYNFMLMQWFFALLFVWLFLHVFEDSMVNYLFFINFWLLIWMENR